MLGDLICEETGKVTGFRIVDASGSLAKMAGMVGVFEHETDANGKLTSKVWEWK